jgi:hypothetical protein
MTQTHQLILGSLVLALIMAPFKTQLPFDSCAGFIMATTLSQLPRLMSSLMMSSLLKDLMLKICKGMAQMGSSVLSVRISALMHTRVKAVMMGQGFQLKMAGRMAQLCYACQATDSRMSQKMWHRNWKSRDFGTIAWLMS